MVTEYVKITSAPGAWFQVTNQICINCRHQRGEMDGALTYVTWSATPPRGPRGPYRSLRTETPSALLQLNMLVFGSCAKLLRPTRRTDQHLFPTQSYYYGSIRQFNCLQMDGHCSGPRDREKLKVAVYFLVFPERVRYGLLFVAVKCKLHMRIVQERDIEERTINLSESNAATEGIRTFVWRKYPSECSLSVSQRMISGIRTTRAICDSDFSLSRLLDSPKTFFVYFYFVINRTTLEHFLPSSLIAHESALFPLARGYPRNFPH